MNRRAAKCISGKRKENWFQRSLLIIRLRAKWKVSVFRRAYVRLYAINCRAEELAQVNNIETSQLITLAETLQRWLHITGAIPPVRVFFFGRDTKHEDTPKPIRGFLFSSMGYGAWLCQIGTIVILFHDRVPVRRILLHELTHALLDLLTNGFQYPRAIEEGYARLMEYHIKGNDSDIEREKHLGDYGSGKGGYLTDPEFMSIRELLFFDVVKHWNKGDAPAFYRMVKAAFWLNTYLAKLKHQCGPIVEKMLAELKSRNITTPENVYQWIKQTCAMEEVELERGFYRYCTLGDLSTPAGKQ